MAQPIPTRLDTVLLALQARLMSWLGWPQELVPIVDLSKLSFHHQADAYVCLWADIENVNLPILFGAGRIDARATDKVFVAIRTRFATDEASTSLQWLTDKTLGHINTRHKVWDALLDFQPTDQTVSGGDDGTFGNWLVTQPIVPASGTRPRPESEQKEWGESLLWFDVTYILLLTQSYQ